MGRWWATEKPVIQKGRQAALWCYGLLFDMVMFDDFVSIILLSVILYDSTYFALNFSFNCDIL